MASDAYPPFDQSVERFRAFARQQGAPDDVVFVTPQNVIFRPEGFFVRRPHAEAARKAAAARYAAAVQNARGVLICGLCRLGTQVCAYVYGPKSDDEAARLMYPNGLKLSVRTPLGVARETPALSWLWLRARELIRPTRHKEELFK